VLGLNGFFDGVDPPIFTGGTTILTWAPGIYSGSYGTFTVALAPSAPEASTWAMMLAGFGSAPSDRLRGCGSRLRLARSTSAFASTPFPDCDRTAPARGEASRVETSV
jgi:hypothetical protein